MDDGAAAAAWFGLPGRLSLGESRRCCSCKPWNAGRVSVRKSLDHRRFIYPWIWISGIRRSKIGIEIRECTFSLVATMSTSLASTYCTVLYVYPPYNNRIADFLSERSGAL
ncbi:hypothetical protein BP00DRAFT_12994 [Aspergillus indologenus CBS 114.80]|uniref:Uncharacterized protein n=1 Tax=Aspergillus indologenus CBS 114.80 TaxID=1450541 RepID=A0A2V5I1B5_9EURO|nr:hypothetical protein BP00DRAFT_12994 [Aspergillus indologenus CBS 114.80]